MSLRPPPVGGARPHRRWRKHDAARKRVLIVNAFFDEYRRTRGSPHRVPRAMAPVYLAGAFSPDRCDVRLYNEQFSGPLRDIELLRWADMLVLTGVTSAFDRMLHLTAYARTLNPEVVVAAGGPAVRALPRRSARFFDYACLGDIEQLQSVARECFGAAFVAEDPFPRFDLADRGRMLAYVESSRNCNFQCSFCSLTGEGAKYQKYDLGFIERQIVESGKKHIVFIDNNFYGNDRRFYLARIDLLEALHRSGRIEGWSALVTGDFFRNPENLERARRAGCFALFSGVESFDSETLRSYNKRHNTLVPQVEMIQRCLEAGVLFTYGIMLDPTTRSLADLHKEIAFIVGTPEISLPAFFTLPIPLLGTPYFRESVERGLLLPNVRLRDLDGVTVAMRPRDPLDEVVAFARDLPRLRGHRLGVARHTAGFLRRYRKTLKPIQLFAAATSGALICTETFASSPSRLSLHRNRQTYLSTTEPLDPLYTPMIRVPGHLTGHFLPTMVTDEGGRLADDVAADLSSASSPAPARRSA